MATLAGPLSCTPIDLGNGNGNNSNGNQNDNSGAPNDNGNDNSGNTNDNQNDNSGNTNDNQNDNAGQPIPEGEFEPMVNTTLPPGRPDVMGPDGVVERTCSSRDGLGVQSYFVEGVALVSPDNDADLQAFLDRYDGEVISDNSVPEPPASLGIVLTQAQRRPTQYVVRLNLDNVDAFNLTEDGAAAGLTGLTEFSSDAALRTFAAVFNAKAAGYRAQINYVYEGTQNFPTTLFRTSERPVTPATVPPTFTDPFTAGAYADFGTAGPQTNVTQAWQFIAAHGIVRRINVAIIDGGFWLNTMGQARGADSDFPPAPATPVQYDFDGDDYIADDVNPNNCSGGNACYWHGTGSAGVATGIANNQLGGIGTGGQIADPFLFRVNGSKGERNRALRTAIAWGADVVSMSFGGDCNQACRVDDRDENPFDDAVGAGSRTVFVAAAGNGRGNPAVGYSVGSPNFVHPCIEDNVICVGALNPGTNNIISYSNFGPQVQVFAPTNIPVMSYPPSVIFPPCPMPPACPAPVTLTPAQSRAAAEQTQTFGGTSASTPFVAGIVAMMKAVNPDLGQRDVEQILIQTAGNGVAPVTRTVNAYAAVKRAADMRNIARDRFENNDLETNPADLGATATFAQSNLNIDTSDRDFFKFQSPGGSLMTVSLAYPQGLGAVNIFDLESISGGLCGPPNLVSTSIIPGGGMNFLYQVPGGELRMGLNATDNNAYNLGIVFASAAFAPDVYEVNDQVSTAKRLLSYRLAGSGALGFLAIDPRVSIDATIHNTTDLDYFIIRGPTVTLAERIFLSASPSVRIFGNDSLINLNVYRLNPDNTQGPLVDSVSAGGCPPESALVRLESDVYYLVRVSGSPGPYKLSNGVTGDRRYIPSLVRDRIYDVLHPLDPIERVIRFPELYVHVADRAYSALRIASPSIQMRLTDFDGNLVRTSVLSGGVSSISLANLVPNAAYALELIPTINEGDEPPMVQLEWDEVEPDNSTGNLVRNPGAETVIGEVDIPDWNVPEGVAAPRLYFYDDMEGNPSLDDPGPPDRGMHLFAGGNNTMSAIQQTTDVPPAFAQAVSEGRARFNFSAYLGGNSDQTDYASATLIFLNANQQPIDEVTLAPITELERENQTGLLPAQADGYVPEDTQYFSIELTFTGGDGDFNDGYVDNVSLVLEEFTP